MVHSKTNYSIWKNIKEDSHPEDYCCCGFIDVSFSVTELVSLGQTESNSHMISNLEANLFNKPQPLKTLLELVPN